MSWEEMTPQTWECKCGKGTVTREWEMDDWSRTRGYTVINCPECRQKDQEEKTERQRTKERDEELYERAKKLAIERFMEPWLAFYTDLGTKAAWLRYTGGSGYPALGTFSKHVKHEGIPNYMRRSFQSDFERALQIMKIEDKDILDLLAQCSPNRGKVLSSSREIGAYRWPR